MPSTPATRDGRCEVIEFCQNPAYELCRYCEAPTCERHLNTSEGVCVRCFSLIADPA